MLIGWYTFHIRWYNYSIHWLYRLTEKVSKNVFKHFERLTTATCLNTLFVTQKYLGYIYKKNHLFIALFVNDPLTHEMKNVG